MPVTARDFYLVRCVPAPAKRVYAAWANRDKFRKWIVPPASKLVGTSHEVYPGGLLDMRFDSDEASGLSRALRCVQADEAKLLQFTDFASPDRPMQEAADAVLTFNFERICFAPRRERTVCVVHIRYASEEAFELAEGDGDHSFWASAVERLNALVGN